jgi:hypothetical protein
MSILFPSLLKNKIANLSSSGLVLGQRSEPEIRLDNLQLWPDVLCILSLHARMNNDVLAGHPINRGRHLELVTSLQRVHHAQHLGGVASSRGRVRKNETNGLFRIDDEN